MGVLLTEARRPRYGLDAPPVLAGFGVPGVALLIAGIVTGGGPLIGLGAIGVLTALLMLHSSLRGKLREADRLLTGLELRGDERVLDLGCGRGLLLIGAARRLPNGTAVGIDGWRNRDQGANSRTATLANARAAGVADRVEVLDGDARDLPLADASFDAVVSSLVIHNIAGRHGRDQAIGEAARVLRGGGRLALLDLRGTSDYVATLRTLGFTDVRRSRPRLSMYPPSRLVTARKPTDQPPPPART